MQMLAALVLGLVAAVVSTVQGGTDGAVMPIAGGKFEASGVVALPGGVLFVDDGRSDRLFWMTLDGDGRQRGQAQAVPLGISVPDMEGITTDGTYVYVVGSQSKRESAGGAGLARFTFDVATRRASDVQSIGDLKSLVLATLPEVERAAGTGVDGFNIEGLAWDAARNRLLLGLRAPVVDGHALIIPMGVTNPRGSFNRQNVAIARDDVVRLPVRGGIRSLEYDPVTREFRILSAPEGRAAAFSLWRWSGTGAPERAALGPQIAAREAKPEGLTRVSSEGASYTLFVFDTGGYAASR